MDKQTKIKILKQIKSGTLSANILKVCAGDCFLRTESGHFQDKAGNELSLEALNKVIELTDMDLVYIYLQGVKDPYSVCIKNAPFDRKNIDQTKWKVRRTYSLTCPNIELCKEAISIYDGETRDLSEMTTEELENHVDIFRKIREDEVDSGLNIEETNNLVQIFKKARQNGKNN